MGCGASIQRMLMPHPCVVEWEGYWWDWVGITKRRADDPALLPEELRIPSGYDLFSFLDHLAT